MKTARILFGCLTACGLCGCYSMDTAASPTLSACTLAADDGEIVEHVLLRNSGWFLFERIPLVCGNTDDSWFPWTFFKNETDLAFVEQKLAARARNLDARVVQENVINNGSTLMSIPTVDIALPYLLCRRETQISALLVKRDRGGGE